MIALEHLTDQIGEIREKQAEHGARITGVEKQGDSNSEKLDKLHWWIIGVLVSSVGTLLVVLFSLLKGK